MMFMGVAIVVSPSPRTRAFDRALPFGEARRSVERLPTASSCDLRALGDGGFKTSFG